MCDPGRGEESTGRGLPGAAEGDPVTFARTESRGPLDGRLRSPPANPPRPLRAVLPGPKARGPQKSQVRGARGNGMTSRMFAIPVTNMTRRSKPSPKPACGTVP
jgi:hypothetical protein